MNGKQEYGDYQTPLYFAEQVCLFLKDKKHFTPEVVLEPTCGLGSFLKSSRLFSSKQYYGIEINPEYCKKCKEDLGGSNTQIINSSIFDFNLQALTGTRNVLVIGNPPWVTNSALSTINSLNLPQKSNFKGLNGIDAITGSGNFDISEYIILKILDEYQNTNTAVAMLCKTSVARSVFKEVKRTGACFDCFEAYEFDAKRVFGISASACLLLIRLSDCGISSDECPVYSLDSPDQQTGAFGFRNGHFYNDLSLHGYDFEGRCCFEWRQGVKHDCAKVMELAVKDGHFVNGSKETALLEDALVYPLVKSSMFKSPVISTFTRFVIVTQRKARADTSFIRTSAPRTWKYLNDHMAYFQKRKSAIYKDAPAFSMFGVGDYSFSQYKVGVSGFYKTPLFSLLHSPGGKAVMTDDTSYFICFDSYDLAYAAMLCLNSRPVQVFLKSIAFQDAKRPYTKKVLGRLDFAKICATLRLGDLLDVERRFSLPPHISEEIFLKFKSLCGASS